MVWADTNYLKKKKITISVAEVAGGQTDFPVLVTTIDADLAVCLANGYDIKFYDSTETVQLKHEIEKWTKASGTLEAWVKIPSLSGVVDTIFYIYYNYPGETVDQQDAQDVWDSDFICVLHMHSASTPQQDSTSNGHDFDEHLDGFSPIYQRPGVNNGYSVELPNGTSDVGAAFKNYQGMPMVSYNAATVESWFYVHTSPTKNSGFIFSSRTQVSDDIRHTIRTEAVPNSGQLAGYWDDGVTDGCDGGGIVNIIHGQWYYMAATISNADNIAEVYGDPGHTFQQICTDNSVNFNFGSIDNQHAIGCRKLGQYYNYMDGYLDEWRLSVKRRSSTWLETTYNSIYDPSSFAGFGAEESQISFQYEFKFPLGDKTQHFKYQIGDTQREKYNKNSKNKHKYDVERQR